MSDHLNLPVVITPSRAQGGARCHRKHFLSDVLSRASFSSPSLEFGSLIHAGSAAHWLGNDWRSVIEQEWVTRFVETDVSQKDVSLAMAYSMMDYYIDNAPLAGPFQDAADDWKLVDVEQRFEVPLKDHVLSFQCDRMVYSPSQNWLLIGDLKTAGRLDWRWDRQWEMSLQMKLYKLGGRTMFETGGRVDVFVEGLHKHVPSSLRYYACPDWSDLQLGEAAFNAYNVAVKDEMILLSGSDMSGDGLTIVPNLAKIEEAAVRATTINEGECFSYNSTCPFHKICTADIDERVGILRGEFFIKDEEGY